MNTPTDLVKGAYAAFGRGDLPGVIAACADGVEWRCHAPSAAPFGGRFKGRDGVKTFFEKLLASVRISKFEPHRFLTDGDTVVVLGRDAGTVVATGRDFAEDWVHVFTIRGGRIAEFAEFLEAGPIEAALRKA